MVCIYLHVKLGRLENGFHFCECFGDVEPDIGDFIFGKVDNGGQETLFHDIAVDGIAQFVDAEKHRHTLQIVRVF